MDREKRNHVWREPCLVHGWFIPYGWGGVPASVDAEDAGFAQRAAVRVIGCYDDP